MRPDFPIIRLGPTDLPEAFELIHLYGEAFETGKYRMPAKSYLARWLENPGFIVLAALDGKKVIGGLTAYELMMFHEEQPEIFIYDLAVKKEYQRKGTGTRLINFLKDYAAGKGIRTIFVMANEEDDHAIKFYRAAGGKMEKVGLFTFDTGDFKSICRGNEKNHG